MDNLSKKFLTLHKLIGNTPLVKIKFKYNNDVLNIYSKLEYYNLTGSIKDRMALHIIEKSYLKKKLKENYTIIEATSGNTGISLSAVGTFVGNAVEIYMPDWMSEERKTLIESFGAKLNLVSKSEGGFLECIVKTIDRAQKDPLIFLPSQFSNKDNVECHYLYTGQEILQSLKVSNIVPHGLICGVGTGGTLMGISKTLKDYYNDLKIFALEPANSPTLSTGSKVAPHRIQGIVDEFVPPILDLKSLDKIFEINDGDAIIMAQKLSKELGLGIGISSGANFLGAVKTLESIGYDKNVITVFPDDNKKYVSTDLFKKEPVKDNYLSPHIELLDIKVI